MISELTKIKPYKIISFAPFDTCKENADLVYSPLKIILHSKAMGRQELKPTRWDFRSNNKIHAKIAIGENGLIIGSWNFSVNSTQNMHEAIICISGNPEEVKKCDIYRDANEFFDDLWERCH